MDPRATLNMAAAALDDDDFDAAGQLLQEYREWRGRGGFQPQGGDLRCSELEALLACVPAQED